MPLSSKITKYSHTPWKRKSGIAKSYTELLSLFQRLHGFHLLSFIILSLLSPKPPSETPLSPSLSFLSSPFSPFSHLCLFSLSLSPSLFPPPPLSLPPTPVFSTCSWFNTQSLNQYILLSHHPRIIGSVFHYCNYTSQRGTGLAQIICTSQWIGLPRYEVEHT